MKGFNLNISTLFSSLNNNNTFGSFNLGDYASIKNGSYKKLVKSYYAEQKKADADNKPVTDKTTKKKQAVDSTGMSLMKKDADSLKASVEALSKDDLWKQTNGEYNKDKIQEAVKSFVKDYNDTLTQASKVSSKEVSQDVKYMNSMTTTMTKSLNKIGITVGNDGKLSLNEDNLKKADVKNVKALFTGNVSYGSQIADHAGDISKDAVMNSSMYGSNGMLSNSLSGLFDQMV